MVLGLLPIENACRVPTGFIPDCIRVTGVSTNDCPENTYKRKAHLVELQLSSPQLFNYRVFGTWISANRPLPCIS